MTSATTITATPADSRVTKFSRLADLPAKAWFAYSTILLLELKVLWNIWKYEDLNGGDTSTYFVIAWNFFVHHKINLVRSPLIRFFTARCCG